MPLVLEVENKQVKSEQISILPLILHPKAIKRKKEKVAISLQEDHKHVQNPLKNE